MEDPYQQPQMRSKLPNRLLLYLFASAITLLLALANVLPTLFEGQEQFSLYTAVAQAQLPSTLSSPQLVSNTPSYATHGNIETTGTMNIPQTSGGSQIEHSEGEQEKSDDIYHYWSPWLNGNKPEQGHDDVELQKGFNYDRKREPVCHNRQPLAVECRQVADRVPWNETKLRNQYDCAIRPNRESGGICRSMPGSPCTDFQVRFLCDGAIRESPHTRWRPPKLWDSDADEERCEKTRSCAKASSSLLPFSFEWCRERATKQALPREARVQCYQEQVNRSCHNRTSEMPPCRLIFAINPGRSGSNYIAHVLSTLPNITSVHEPGKNHGSLYLPNQEEWRSPNIFLKQLHKLRQVCGSLNGGCHQEMDNKGNIKGRWAPILCDTPDWGSERIEALDYFDRASLVGARFGNMYSETNPNFKAWMSEALMEGFTNGKMQCELDVLIIRRKIAALVRSLQEQGWFWKKGMDGYAWMMTANSPNSDIRPIGPDDDLDSFDKIISYVLNVEAFSQRLQNDPNWRNNPRVRFHDVRAEETYTQEVRWAMNEKHLVWKH